LDGEKSDAVVKVLRKASIEISGKTVEAWQVKAIYRTIEAKMWIDEEGRLLKGSMPMGMVAVRSNRSEIAEEMKNARELPDILALTAVPVEGPIPDPRTLELLKVKVEAGDQHIPSNKFRQTYDDGILTVTKETVPAGAYSIPLDDRKMEPYLTSSRFIRADHPDIIKKAREIAGDEKDPVKVAKRITEWVFKNLKKVPTPSVPDAYAVLQTKRGDCNEHAVLAVSLARALGLPARIAIGIVHVNDGFYYHAWVNYWAGDKWFSADPLMNQVPVDPTHITLLYGDVEKHMNVVSFLGRLKLHVITTR
jgi:hypothetical protein